MNLLMKYISLVSLLVVVNVCFGPKLIAQSDVYTGITKIMVDDQDGSGLQVGSGLIVGNSKEEVYIISTFELLNNEGSAPLISVQINEQTPPLLAKYVQGSKKNNLAVLQITFPDLEHYQYNMAKDFQLQVAQSVKTIGHTEEESWVENFTNRIKKTQIKADSLRLGISTYQMGREFIGSPVFTENYKWIGMITQVNQREAITLKAQVILKTLDSWNIPTNLIVSVLSDLQASIYLAESEIDQKQSIPIELTSQEIFILVRSFEVSLARNGKDIKKVPPMTLHAGQRNYEFPLKRKLFASRKYTLKYTIDGQEFYSKKFKIGKPGPREIALGAMIAGIGVLIYNATRSLPDPPAIPNN